MNRRRFLQQSAQAAPFAAFALRASVRALENDPTVVVGAGLAGLRTADLLRQAGLPVIVLEARGRVGGRVFTVRAPFPEASFSAADRIAGDAFTSRSASTKAFEMWPRPTGSAAWFRQGSARQRC